MSKAVENRFSQIELNVIQHILKASEQHAKGAGRWMSLDALKGRVIFPYPTPQL